MPLQRVSSEDGARLILQRMIEAGRCTLEDLDTPPPGYEGDPSTYQNLLRDYYPESVQAAPDPKDFAEPGSDLRSDHAPLPVEGNSGSVFSDGRDQLGHEPGSRSSDSEGQAELGTEGEPAPLSSGSTLDW